MSTLNKNNIKTKKMASYQTVYGPLVPINALPIRNEWIQKFQQIQAKIKKYALELDSFLKQDQPEFEKWKRTHFGKDYLEIQQENEKLNELQAWMEEMGEYVFKYDLSDFDAYQLACLRRSDSLEFERVRATLNEKAKRREESLKKEREDTDSHFDFNDFNEDENEDENFFDEMNDDFFGFFLDEDSLMFKEQFSFFKESVFLKEGLEFKKEYSNEVNEYLKKVFLRKESYSSIKFQHLLKGGSGGCLDNKESRASECKSIYRRLVHILHPDRNQRGGEQRLIEKEIWGEVQDAYQKKDTEKLRTLEAMVQLHRGEEELTGSISDLKSAVLELEKNLSATQSQIKKARQDPAWKFVLKKGALPKGKWERVYKKILNEKEALLQEREYFQSLFKAAQNKRKSWSVFH